MAKGAGSLRRTRPPAGDIITTSLTVRPLASSRNGQAFRAFDVTPPPHAFASRAGLPSNSATRAPPRAVRSAAKETAGPAPIINTSKISSPLNTLLINRPSALVFIGPSPRASLAGLILSCARILQNSYQPREVFDAPGQTARASPSSFGHGGAECNPPRPGLRP